MYWEVLLKNTTLTTSVYKYLFILPLKQRMTCISTMNIYPFFHSLKQRLEYNLRECRWWCTEKSIYVQESPTCYSLLNYASNWSWHSSKINTPIPRTDWLTSFCGSHMCRLELKLLPFISRPSSRLPASCNTFKSLYMSQHWSCFKGNIGETPERRGGVHWVFPSA